MLSLHLSAAACGLALLLIGAVSGAILPNLGAEARKFELTLTWDRYAADGFERNMALINGQFPGPVLEINQGEDVEILVHNEMPWNTTIHCHGIEMQGSPWSDGMPGVTQLQIRPGNSFLYKWKATQYGSYWYHAHHRGQIDDGLYGPIVIHPKEDERRPFHLIDDDEKAVKAMIRAEANVKPLVLSDWRHFTSEDTWQIQLDSGIELPCYDSLLINGKGNVQCWDEEKTTSLLSASQKMYLELGNETRFTDKSCLSGQIIANVLGGGLPANLSVVPPEVFDNCAPTTGRKEIIEVKKSNCTLDTYVAFNVIGTFGLMTTSFSIDGHPMYVYAVDGSYIEPQLVQAITVTNGDRYSVMVKLGEPGDYTIRVASIADIQLVTAYATLSVRGPGGDVNGTPDVEPFINDAGRNTSANVSFYNQAAMKSFPKDKVSPIADRTFKLGMKIAGRSHEWALNSTTYPLQLDNEHPLLFEPDPSRNNNVTITTKYGEWVDIVLMAVQFPQPSHPIHKHGNKMYLLGQGDGDFPYESVAEAIKEMPQNFNLVDPPKRDTFSTPPALTGPTWTVVRYHATNPGAWFLHCHIQTHMLGGMAMVIQDGVDKWPIVPEEYLNYEQSG